MSDGIDGGDNDNKKKRGYGHPPEEHQFKPGQSGNPKGRKPEPETVDEMILAFLKKKMKVGDKMMKFKKAAVHRGLAELVKANPVAAMKMFQVIREAEELAGHPLFLDQQEAKRRLREFEKIKRRFEKEERDKKK